MSYSFHSGLNLNIPFRYVKIYFIAALLLFNVSFIYGQDHKSSDNNFSVKSMFLTIGGVYRGNILDDNIDSNIFQFSKYYENTKGFGGNIGVKLLFKNSFFLDLNSNIRYDYIYTEKDPLTNKAVKDIKELIFDPSLGIGRNFSITANENIYIGANVNLVNSFKRFSHLNETASLNVFELSYLTVGLNGGYIKNNFFVEPQIQYIPKGQYIYGVSTSHIMLGVRVGYLMKFYNRH